MPFDVREITNFFLDTADVKKKPLTNMGLQKTLYYAHGWHLKIFKEPLIKNSFEAWEYGPVIKTIYDEFRGHKDLPIKSRAKKFSSDHGDFVVVDYQLNDNLKAFLENIFELYGTKHPYELSKMSHAEDGPWNKIREKSRTEVCLQMKIPNDLIASYFEGQNVFQ